jgi:TM2 domain-containing membrane protein YozV
MEKVWEIKDPSSYRKGTTRKLKRPVREQKNPATAYSRSILIWGSGQSYNGEFGKSLAFSLLMIAVYLGTGLALFFRSALFGFLKVMNVPFSDAFLAAEVLLLCILLFWFGSAGSAYHTASKTLTTRFRGTPSRITPGLCSLILPGWGQFLNGQPIKGSILSALGALGIFSLVSVPAVLYAWPLLEASDTRFIIESVFVVSILSAPLLPLAWLYGFYDAVVISVDEYKKEPLWERIKAANNRRRTQGWVRGVFPWIGRSFALILILTFLVIVFLEYFPAGYYGKLLALVRGELTQRGMTILPGLITKLLAVVPAT